MTKRRKLINCIMAMLIFSGAMNLSGCSLNSILDEFKDPDELAEELHQKPRFWYDAVAYSEKDGLHTLANEFFQRKPYNNIFSYGDNVLLVGQGTYLDEDFEFSFDLYNPWKNSIVASIAHDEIFCDDYQVVGNNLFLINSNNNTIDIYDDNLSFIQRLNMDSYGDISNYRYFPSSDENHFLAYNQVDRTLKEIDRQSFDASEYDFSLYSSTLEAVSDDGQELLVSGIDENSLHFEIQTIDTASKEKTNIIRGTNYYPSDVNDNGFLTTVDSTWIYHDNDTHSDIRFEADNITKTSLLPDNSFILNSQDFMEEGEGSNSTSYCHVSKDGEVLSSFTFDCGDSSQPGYVYFSSDFAYLEEANCIMFLNYTTDVNPYILIWDLNVESGKNDLNVKLLEEENSEAAIIDFGALEEVNNEATELEESYGVDIYIGDEVPPTIDVFNTSTVTSPDLVEDSLDKLEAILSCYPDNFFKQLCYGNLEKIEIYLAGDITSTSEETISAAGGFVTVENTKIIMVLDANESEYWDYTVHHELSHMIDRRLDFRILYDTDSIYSEEGWNKLNPEAFSYLDSYANYSDNPDYISHTDYFIDDYGTTFSTEDRAEIFGRAMDDYMNDISDTAFFQESSPIRKKLAYYSEAIREGFDTTGWPQTMPWEVMLYK